MTRLIGCLGLICALFVPVSSASDLVAGCPFAGQGGDQITRAFYVENLAAVTLDKVEVALGSSVTHPQTITLTARLGAFDGPIIGRSAKKLEFRAGAPNQQVLFEYGNVPIPLHSTIAFVFTRSDNIISVTGDVGEAPCIGTVVQTAGHTPPLDTFRRGTYGVAVFGDGPLLLRDGFESP